MVEYDVMSMVKLLFLFSLLALEHQNAQTGKVNVDYKMSTCLATRQRTFALQELHTNDMRKFICTK